MAFEFQPSGPTEGPAAVDRARDIAVYWEHGLARRPERFDIGGAWRFEHPAWSFVILVAGEEWDSEWVSTPSGAMPAYRKVYGHEARMMLWTHDDPRKTLGSVVPPDINATIAEAMISIYSQGGAYPGILEYLGTRRLKRSYSP